MEYKLKIGQTDIAAEVLDRQEQQLNFRLDEQEQAVEYQIVSDHWIHMVVNQDGTNRRVNAWVMDGPDGKIVMINGRTYLVQNQRNRRVHQGLSKLPEQITPPMPAVVVAIPVSLGEPVKKGQAVMVVSAMKMETTLRAPFDGTVAKINAAVNDKVTPGQILVEIATETDAGAGVLN